MVQVQNQHGAHAHKWDLSGVIVEILGFDAYLVKLDGTGRVSKRNRRFLRPIRTYKSMLTKQGVDKDTGTKCKQSVGLYPPSHYNSYARVGADKDIVIAENSPVVNPCQNDNLLSSGRAEVTGDTCHGTASQEGDTGLVSEPVDGPIEKPTHTDKARKTEKPVETSIDGPIVRSRPVRAAKVPDRFQAGDPSDRAFQSRRRK